MEATRTWQALAAAAVAAALLFTAAPVAAFDARPQEACAWLVRLGLEPGPYREMDGARACIASRLVSLGPPQNTLTYVVIGGEDSLRELRLELAADELKKADAGLELMARAAEMLVRRATGSEAPAGLARAVHQAGEGSWELEGARARLLKKPLGGGSGGFRLHFWLERP
jgi:hypothetical protein